MSGASRLFASSSLRVSALAESLEPARDDPARMRTVERERVDGIARTRQRQRVALAIEATQHGVGELARANAVTSLGQLDGLRDRGVRRHALHVEQLSGTEPQQVEQVGVEANGTAAHARVEVRVDARPTAEHAVDELANPSPVARVEARRATIERRIEQITAANVRANLRRRDTRVGHTTTTVHNDSAAAPHPRATDGPDLRLAYLLK